MNGNKDFPLRALSKVWFSSYNIVRIDFMTLN
jgi:hypothetical protein